MMKSSSQWVEESVTFDAPMGRQVATPGNAAHLGSSFTKKKYLIFVLLSAAVLASMAARMVYLQIVRGDAYRTMAEGNRARLIPIPAERGLIFDRHGTALTKNIPEFSLALVPQNLPRDPKKREEIVRRLAELTGRSDSDIWHILEEYGAYSFESIIIQDDVDYETALMIQIAAADLPGIEIQRGSKRLYIHEGFAVSPGDTVSTSMSISHVLGYEGKLNRSELDTLYTDGYLPSDSIGKTGLEKTEEPYLRGEYGKKHIEVNAIGREQSVLAETAPVPGRHVFLTLDIAIQKTLEDILRRTLKASGKHRAAAVALDPRNGDVLALVSLPAFDNNDFSGGIDRTTYASYTGNTDHPLFNRAIGGTYPSGSTIKPAIASAALEEGVITPHTTIQSTGGLQVGPWFFPDWRAGGHGATDVRKSLAQSVNTFYYYIGGGYKSFTGLGLERLTDAFRDFGFGSILGIDIPGEAPGFIPDKAWKQKMKGESWYIGDTYNLSIGEGDLLVTPLQIAEMTAAVANNGTLYRPHLVSALMDPVTKIKQPHAPEIIRSSGIHADALQTVRLGMRDCVLSGSCRRLNTLPMFVAGKTGTAQWRKDKENHAWFTSFAPFDAPEIVLTVLVEEGGEGSGIAVPVADEFYRWWSMYGKISRSALQQVSNIVAN